jgi:GAF domain-containing protein
MALPIDLRLLSRGNPPMSTVEHQSIAVCLTLTDAISRTETVDEIYDIALDAIEDGLGVARASVLAFDEDGVMRFMACRRLSASYRRAVEGHTPWQPTSPNPQPIVVSDVTADTSLRPYLSMLRAEGIAALTFIPLVNRGRVIGKFMLYYESPYAPSEGELRLARIIASQWRLPWPVRERRSKRAAVSRACGSRWMLRQ